MTSYVEYPCCNLALLSSRSMIQHSFGSQLKEFLPQSRFQGNKIQAQIAATTLGYKAAKAIGTILDYDNQRYRDRANVGL